MERHQLDYVLFLVIYILVLALCLVIDWEQIVCGVWVKIVWVIL